MTAYLAVARVRKPHGLKGEVVAIPLTDNPDDVFEVGRRLTPLDDEGRPAGDDVTIVRARPFHREWLLSFDGYVDRNEMEPWRRVLLGVPEGELEGAGEEEIYIHEVPGVTVLVNGDKVGTASGLIDVPGGWLLAVDVEGKEVLVPFRDPIVVRIDREAREIELDPPPGLMEI